MEYGWNRIQEPNADGEDNASIHHRDHTDTMSIRSGRSVRMGRHNSNLHRGGPIPADRIFIHEWKPPMHPSLVSTYDEETQLEALQKQVGNLKLELEKHNALRKPMQELVRNATALLLDTADLAAVFREIQQCSKSNE